MEYSAHNDLALNGGIGDPWTSVPGTQAEVAVSVERKVCRDSKVTGTEGEGN